MTLILGLTILVAVIVVLLFERARAGRRERDLRNSEERLRLVLDSAPAMIWTARPDTTLDFLNGTCVRFTGMPIEKLRDEGWLDAVHPDDRDHATGVYTPAIEARLPFSFEYRVRRADGTYRWLMAQGVPKHDPDGKFTGFVGCDFDITERRYAEDRITDSRAALERSFREIQDLTGRLIAAQDSERARIARDLHDDVSQQLAGLSIAISGLKRRVDEPRVNGDLRADLDALQHRASTLANNVRHLSHDLHPTVLRHAGLLAALTTHCEELAGSHGLTLVCRAEGPLESLPPEVGICLYRIAQEALRNVVAHAGAARADVLVSRMGNDAEITITDDGAGFDVERTLGGGKGLGLVSVNERARFAGGDIRIVSQPGRGTEIRARIPIRASINGLRHELDIA